MRRRLLLTVLAALTVVGLWPWVWCPTDGLDQGHNALWLSHAWLGGPSWFQEHERDPAGFRGSQAHGALAERVAALHVDRVYPHLCPTDSAGHLPSVDGGQLRDFADALPGVQVLPWIGGVLHRHVFLDDPAWRETFVTEAAALVRDGGFAGVHVNIEPLPSGTPEFLDLLEALRAALPAGARISVAAYPPQVLATQVLEVHWTPAYFRQVADRADEVAVMTYDSGMVLPGPFSLLVARWAQHVRDAAGAAEVLLGVPTYDDEWMTWHYPSGEHLMSGLAGLGLVDLGPNYRGVAIYANWELDHDEVAWLRRTFVAP